MGYRNIKPIVIPGDNELGFKWKDSEIWTNIEKLILVYILFLERFPSLDHLTQEDLKDLLSLPLPMRRKDK